MTTNSMTGFAATSGSDEGWSWSWDIRSVNGRGLDVRLRIPDWIDGLEAGTRAAFKGRVARGNITASLRIKAETEGGAVALNSAGLESALNALTSIEAAAKSAGLELAPTRASDIASMRGVLETASGEDDTGPLLKALLAGLADCLALFLQARRSEGGALHSILEGHVSQIRDLAGQARVAVDARNAATPGTLASAVERVTATTNAVDPERLAQEIALIAVKSDVTEELDRLDAHVTAAEALLSSDDPKGRKLDFLMQEFNREANTLCSKSGDTALTQVGLDLKTVIDQMREQVQNVE